MSKSDSVCNLGARFSAGCSWSLKQTWSWCCLGLQFSWTPLTSLLRWWPRWRMSWAIPKVLSTSLRHVPTWAGVPKVKKHCWTAEQNVGLWWACTLKHNCTFNQIETCTYGTKWVVPKITMQMSKRAHQVINGHIRRCHVLINIDLRCIESRTWIWEKVYWIFWMWLIYSAFSIIFKWHGRFRSLYAFR